MTNPLHLFVRAKNGLASRWRNVWYRALGVRIEGYCWLRRVSIPRMWQAIRLEKVSLDDGVVLLASEGPPGSAAAEKLILHEGVYVNRNTMFDAIERIEVGPHTMIGPNCYITDGNHGTLPGLRVVDQPMRSSPVIIGGGVWIGADVCILAGARLGDGCVVGAGAVVNDDVPPNAIVAGVPARVIKMR